MDSFKIKKGLGRGLSSLIGDTKINTNLNKLQITDYMVKCGFSLPGSEA